MGYNTTFTGELKFTAEATAPQLAALKALDIAISAVGRAGDLIGWRP